MDLVSKSGCVVFLTIRPIVVCLPMGISTIWPEESFSSEEYVRVLSVLWKVLTGATR